jgi:hypothetical protein
MLPSLDQARVWYVWICGFVIAIFDTFAIAARQSGSILAGTISG